MSAPFKYTADEIIIKYEQYITNRKNEYDIRYDCIKSGERAGETIEIKIPKPPTIASFCHFIGITEKTFFNWINEASDNIDPKLFKFVTRIQEAIKDKQLSGALNGIYNPMITCRINGISEQINVNSNVSVQALPSALKNNVIDLTDAEFDVLTE